MRPVAWFMAAPIKRKLTLIGLLTSGLALFSVSLILTVKDVAEWRARTVTELTTYAGVVGASVAATMFFDDRKAAREMLSAFSAKPDINHVVIHDKDDREFAAYHAPGHFVHEMPHLGEGEYAFTVHSLIVSAPIRYKTEVLGAIRLESNLEGLYSGLLRNTILIFLATFGVFLLTVYFFSRLQKVIVAPILDLAEVMQKVSNEQNYEVRAAALQQDEIGMLARNFNEMLERIQLRDAELALHRERLEEEVGQRTTDLRVANAKLEIELAERRQAAQALHDSEAQVLQRLAEISGANAELKELNAKLEQAQSQLLQSDKMASIGVLAAGVAHEINNPIGFVGSNLGTLKSYVADFLRLLEAYKTVQQRLPEDGAMFAEVDELKRKIDLDFLEQDVMGLLVESHQGIERVRKIVRDLKDFSHVDAQEKWTEDDIHQGLESTLNVIWNELKYHCEVKKEYGVLPPIECMISQLNQVFMNLLVNAAQAIKEHGTITIRTGLEGERVWIEISDSGAGIPAENLKRIFDPFFTTKPIGKGTGLGLSVSYSIVQKHHGSIEVESEPGKGTTFRIWLPLKQPGALGGNGHG